MFYWWFFHIFHNAAWSFSNGFLLRFLISSSPEWRLCLILPLKAVVLVTITFKTSTWCRLFHFRTNLFIWKELNFTSALKGFVFLCHLRVYWRTKPLAGAEKGPQLETVWQINASDVCVSLCSCTWYMGRTRNSIFLTDWGQGWCSSPFSALTYTWLPATWSYSFKANLSAYFLYENDKLQNLDQNEAQVNLYGTCCS